MPHLLSWGVFQPTARPVGVLINPQPLTTVRQAAVCKWQYVFLLGWQTCCQLLAKVWHTVCAVTVPACLQAADLLIDAISGWEQHCCGSLPDTVCICEPCKSITNTDQGAKMGGGPVTFCC